jgi:Tfp pilus assembly protein PilO
MSFWLNDGKFIIYSRQISLSHKLLISCGVFIFFTASWFYILYLPAKNKTVEQCLKLAELKHAADDFKKLVKSFESEQDKNKKLHIFFDLFKKSSIDSKNISNYLLELSVKHELSCSGIRPLFSRSKQNYEKEYFNLTINGRYHNFLNFLEEINLQNLILKFSYVNVVRWKDEKVKADIVFRNIKFLKI